MSVAKVISPNYKAETDKNCSLKKNIYILLRLEAITENEFIKMFLEQ
jgi:hypothetical protein